MSIKVSFDNEDVVKQAIADVHNDNSDITWCCVTHLNDDPNTLSLQSTGKGGVEEMLNSLSDTKVQYCLYRSTLKVDLSETVKFTFIYNLGEKVSFFKKGRFGIVKGDAIHYFEPYHIDFEISSSSELTTDIIEKKLRDAAGVAVVEKQDEQVTKVAPVNNDTLPNHQVKTETPIETKKEPAKFEQTSNVRQAPVRFEKPLTVNENSTTKKKPSFNRLSKTDEVQFDQSIIDGIKKVRNDNDPTKWVIGSYKDDDISKPVELIASGEGDCTEMKAHFTPEKICYALIRVIDVYENINTVKFVFIYWLGSKVSVMKKAKISVHKGKVNEMFSNYHVDFMISSLNEISNEIIMRKVSQCSGSRSMVTRY